MTYTPYHADWHDDPLTDTPITAAALEHMEQGIVEASTFVNVLSFGAIGDGTTDDTTAIQAAIDAAAATRADGTSGGRVLVPAGTYKVSATLVVPTGVVVSGVGQMGTVIKASSSSVTLARIGPMTGTAFGARFERLTLHANGSPGCVVTYCAQEGSGLRDVTVRDYTDVGFGIMAPASGAAPAMVAVDMCQFWGADAGSRAGILLDHTNAAEPITISRTTVLGYSTSTGDHDAAIEVISSTVHISGCYLEKAIDGIVASASSRLTVTDVAAENGPGIAAGSAVVRIVDAATEWSIRSVQSWLGRNRILLRDSDGLTVSATGGFVAEHHRDQSVVTP